MSSTNITNVSAVLAFDSRGNPTVSATVTVDDRVSASAMAPSGASTGAHEAHELRDGGKRFGGKHVQQAIENVAQRIRPVVLGLDATDQSAVDDAMRHLDGTANLSRVGANAILSVSLATALGGARATQKEPYEYFAAGKSPMLPLPMVNIFSGGAHASGALDIQDVLAVPLGASSVAESMEWVWELRHYLEGELSRRGHNAQLVADEGGFGVALESNRAALQLVTEGIEAVGLRPGTDMGIALDIAATELLHEGNYFFSSEARSLTAHQLVDEIAVWAQDYPVVSVEDAVGEDDVAGWAYATEKLNSLQLIGDDLFVTSAQRLTQGVADGVANSVLVKANQCGTLSETRSVVSIAQDAGYSTVLSARSGETEEAWLADVAVGWQTGQIKVGSLTRSERTAKWNRLLQIESDLGSRAVFAGAAALAGRPGSAQALSAASPHEEAKR